MNIQIFGTKKSSDTRKAERFFKERGIKFQSIDLKEKGLSKGEFNSVMQAVGGVDAMIDPGCKDRDLLALVTYISADERAEKVMENGFRCIDAEYLIEIHNDIVIRKLCPEETDLLKVFLYEAIFIPEGAEPPDRNIVERPELRLYYDHLSDL